LGFFKACLDSSREFLETVKLQSFVALTERFEIGEGGDRSMKADLLSEEIFAKRLAPFGRIYSEESGYIGEGDATIYLDPLDGSDNFAAGIPYYGVSVCLTLGEKPKKSFIMNFVNGDIFYKENQPLFANIYGDTELKPCTKRAYSTLGIFEKAYANPKTASVFFQKNIKFRSPGALALSLAYGTSCSFVLFIGTLRVFDIIAALHFLDDAHIYNQDGVLLISYNKDIFEEILELVITTQGGQDVL
jgi:myo-inositol-1(or 4)-monophosphatase